LSKGREQETETVTAMGTVRDLEKEKGSVTDWEKAKEKAQTTDQLRRRYRHHHMRPD
jgi:hypothetical protein